jgi:hypothetical protein
MIYIPLGVAIVCFILYALDRRSKNEKIDWFIIGGKPQKDVYYFVSYGKVTVDNKEKTQLSYFKVLANNQVSILANEDSYIIKVWE